MPYHREPIDERTMAIKFRVGPMEPLETPIIVGRNPMIVSGRKLVTKNKPEQISVKTRRKPLLKSLKEDDIGFSTNRLKASISRRSKLLRDLGIESVEIRGSWLVKTRRIHGVVTEVTRINNPQHKQNSMGKKRHLGIGNKNNIENILVNKIVNFVFRPNGSSVFVKRPNKLIGENRLRIENKNSVENILVDKIVNFVFKPNDSSE